MTHPACVYHTRSMYYIYHISQEQNKGADTVQFPSYTAVFAEFLCNTATLVSAQQLCGTCCKSADAANVPHLYSLFIHFYLTVFGVAESHTLPISALYVWQVGGTPDPPQCQNVTRGDSQHDGVFRSFFWRAQPTLNAIHLK